MILITMDEFGVWLQSELDRREWTQADFATGTALIRHGKGNKARTVVFSRQTSRPLRKYLKLRDDDHDALFVSVMRSRLTYEGVRHMIRKRSGRAGIKTPSLHSFRRAFALNCLRNGMDEITMLVVKVEVVSCCTLKGGYNSTTLHSCCNYNFLQLFTTLQLR